MVLIGRRSFLFFEEDFFYFIMALMIWIAAGEENLFSQHADVHSIRDAKGRPKKEP